MFFVVNRKPFWEAGILPLNYSRSFNQIKYCRFSGFKPTKDLLSMGIQILPPSSTVPHFFASLSDRRAILKSKRDTTDQI